MTDTGQVPGKGLPENAGMVEQPGVPAPGAYTYLDHSGSAPEAVTEDDDLLLMPGAQGAWSDPQAAAPPAASEPAPTAAQEAGHVQPVPVAQDTTAARYAPVPGTQPVPGYADAGAAAVPAPGQPHAPVVQEQQYLSHEQQFPTPEQHAAYVQGVPQQALHAQAVAPQATAEQAVAGQAVDPGQYAVPAEPAPHGQSTLHAQPAVQVRSADQGQPVDQAQSAPEQHTGAAEQPAHEAGAHEAGGRDSGSLDLGGVRMPPPAVAAQTPARRPLHMGPPVPEANSGVVRSLADRGPAAHRAGGSAAPRQSAVAAPVAGPPTGGLEYLDVPRDEGDLLPGPQLGEIPPQATSPWAAQQAQPHVAVAAPEETAPETAAAETVPPQAVQGSAAEAAVHAPQAAPTEPHPAAVPAEAPQDPMATGQFVPVEGSLPTGPSLAPSPVAVTAPAPASAEQEQEQEALTETADATALPAAEPAVGQQPEPGVADVPPVAVAEPVPAPEAETAEPATVPQQTAAAVPGEAPEPGPLAEPEPLTEAEAVATVPAPRETGPTDGTAAPGQDGPAADALGGTRPAAPPAPVTEESPVAESEPVDSGAAAAGRTSGAEAATDAETPVAPADADHGTAGSVPAPTAEPAPESEPGAEPR
ncbi:5,6-dimethylbenzimidazole synthase, partial [Streptomyces sp. NPDC096153]